MEPITEFALAAAGCGEVGLLCLGAMAHFLERGNTLAEAAAYALIVPLMALSALFQAGFILGTPALVPAAEVCLGLAAAGSAWAGRRRLAAAWAAAGGFFADHRLPATLLLAVWGYLALRAVGLPPAAGEGQLLERVAAWQASGSLLGPEAPLPPVPINAMVLPHLFLRTGSPLGAGLFGWMAYLAICFATYSLARRHAWPPTAFTVTLVTASFPRLVTLAPSPGIEIVPAAAAVFCLLVLYRLVEQAGMQDLFLLAPGICFCMPAEETCFILPAVLILLSLVLLIRRHGILIWGRALRFHPWAVLGLLPPLLVLSQVWLFAANHARSGSWSGGASWPPLAYNADGLQGALANLVRYLLESAHFTEPVNRLCQWAAGFRPSDALQGLYDGIARPLFAGLGGAAPFRISWLLKGPDVWFGPFAFLLTLPALGYALFRGSRRLKATSLALTGYVYAVCLVCAWTPGNARFFTPVFVCGGFCSAFFLPPWRLSRSGKGAIQALSLLLMAAAAASLR